MPSFRSLDSGEEAELDRYLIHAVELVPIMEDKQEEGFLLLAAHFLLESIRSGDPLPAGVSKEEVTCWLGTLWGEELCRIAGWEWGYVELDNGFSGAAVVERDRRMLCFPINCIHGWLKKDATNQCMNLFTQLCQKPSPEIQPNSWVVMG